MKHLQKYLEPWWVKLILVGLIIVFCLVLINYMDLRARELESHDPKKYQANIVRRSVRILRRLAVVPEDETPVVATIIDVESLKKQNPAFYARAQNGNTVVLYKSVAYVLDEKTQKVVSIGPVFAN